MFELNIPSYRMEDAGTTKAQSSESVGAEKPDKKEETPVAFQFSGSEDVTRGLRFDPRKGNCRRPGFGIRKVRTPHV